MGLSAKLENAFVLRYRHYIRFIPCGIRIVYCIRRQTMGVVGQTCFQSLSGPFRILFFASQLVFVRFGRSVSLSTAFFSERISSRFLILHSIADRRSSAVVRKLETALQPLAILAAVGHNSLFGLAKSGA